MTETKHIRFYGPIPANKAQALVCKMPPPFVGVVALDALEQFNRVDDHPSYLRAYGPGRFTDGVTIMRDELVAHMPSLAATFPV